MDGVKITGVDGDWAEKRGQIIAVDYDGTLDFAGYPNVGKMDMGAVEILKKTRKYGNSVILWTCRCGEPLENAVAECKKHGLEFDAVNENLPQLKEAGFKSPKIVADIYIDDRACGFGETLKTVWQELHDQIEQWEVEYGQH